MRFKPGTTQAQMQATMEALANRPETRGSAGIGGTRPYGGSMNLGTAAGPGGGRPGMSVPPSSQINPAQPNVMGFPDRGVGGANQYNINKPSGYQPGARPYGASANLGTTAGPGGGRPGMGVPSSAPVKKAVGGPVKAKAVARPAAKMAKPMPAMKRGGKVMAKGRKK